MQDITNLTEDFITETIASGEVILDFYSDTCGPCKMMIPVLESLSEDFQDVSFMKINAAKQQKFSERFGVRSLPYFVFLRDNEVISSKTGAAPKEIIKQFINTAKGM